MQGKRIYLFVELISCHVVRTLKERVQVGTGPTNTATITPASDLFEFLTSV